MVGHDSGRLTVPSVESDVLTEPVGQPLPEVVRLAMVIKSTGGACRDLSCARSTGLAVAKAAATSRARECMAT